MRLAGNYFWRLCGICDTKLETGGGAPVCSAFWRCFQSQTFCHTLGTRTRHLVQIFALKTESEKQTLLLSFHFKYNFLTALLQKPFSYWSHVQRHDGYLLTEHFKIVYCKRGILQALEACACSGNVWGRCFSYWTSDHILNKQTCHNLILRSALKRQLK